MAKSIIMAFVCLVFIFTSVACDFKSDKPEAPNKEKIVKSRTPLFPEPNPVDEGEMAASPFLTKPLPKTASTK